MRALLIQPPFTQLNAPYPAVHYLDRFLRDRGLETEVRDDSIGLYRLLMTSEGVRRLFMDAREALDAREKPGAGARVQAERYFSLREKYASWAGPLVRFLSSGDPALAFRISGLPDDLPRGLRSEGFIEERGGVVRPEEAPALAIRILDDLGDFISWALDPDFGTVRYAERLASSRAEYGPVSEAADSGYVLRSFYRPWLRRSFDASGPGSAPDLLLLSVPFPGCLAGAIAAAREARSAFGPALRIAMGGGYVSTELRNLKDPSVFEDLDALCFDAGYGALVSLLDRMDAERRGLPAPAPYRTARRAPGGAVEYLGFPAETGCGGSSPREEDGGDRAPGDDPGGAGGAYRVLEDKALRTVHPDYRSADMGAYIRTPSSENPMHRIWSDAPWLKYRLAYGCYWRRCAFCDTRLDYVRRYLPSEVPALFSAAVEASDRTGLTGIHFTDEALPLPALLEFARLNREAGNRFTYWGNVRFDRVWTEDRCALLAASGFVAASGGIEIATERGLAMTGKGFTFPDLVRSLAAFKRSGILVHGYLIYGFPSETEQDLVDSAEAVRQLFAAGLLDSAFWHRFVLTRHSEMYARWRAGGLPDLEPIERPGRFASNDLDFRGSERWDPFDEPLERLLGAWMAGTGLDTPVRPLRAGGPRPSLAKDRVERLAREAAVLRADAAGQARARAHWLAGLPDVDSTGDGRGAGQARIRWTDRGEPAGLDLPRPAAEGLARGLAALASRPEGMALPEFLQAAGLSGALGKDEAGPETRVFRFLRENGLAVV